MLTSLVLPVTSKERTDGVREAVKYMLYSHNSYASNLIVYFRYFKAICRLDTLLESMVSQDRHPGIVNRMSQNLCLIGYYI